MKNIIMYLLLILSATAAAQDIPCPPGIYSPTKFVTPPIIDLGPTFTPPTTPPVDPPEGFRGIYWVHGLGGNASSMAQIMAATDQGAGNGFPARKTVGFAMNYEQTGMPAAGQTLIQNMLTKDGALINLGVTDFTNNFIISHSQGGITSRTAEMLLDDLPETARRHYGIVTIGTPHLGAQIVNSRNNGLVAEFATDACHTVIDVALAKFKTKHPFVGLFVNLQGQSIDDFCDAAAEFLIPFALKSLFSGASNDYAVGAPLLGQLGGHQNPQTHKTSFYGVEYALPEDDPTDSSIKSKQLFWRLLGSPPDAVSNAPAFSANADQELVNQANENMADYQAKYENYAFILNFIHQCQGVEWFLDPTGCSLQEIQFDATRDLRDTYHDAWRWSQGVDRQWKIIIGANNYDHVTYSGVCLCETPDGEYQISAPVLCETNPGNCSLTNPIQPIIRESDGVVVTESQKGFPGAADARRMEYANHFQERNCTATKDALLVLFNDGAGDKWFRTDLR